MVKTSLLGLLLILISIISYSQSANEKTEQYISAQMKERQIPGLQLAVIKGDSLIFSISKGIADIAFNVPVSDSTIFSINSACKIFAGVGILQLEEAGFLSLDDQIGQHLDSLPKNWQDITLKQLLGHISGLPDIEDDSVDGLVGNKGEVNAWRAVRRLPLLANPGETFTYNATNYLLIQKVLEKYSQMPYDSWVRREQFKTANMKQTFFANSNEVIANKAPSYSFYSYDSMKDDYVKSNQLHQLHENFPIMMHTDAGAFSNVKDLVRWIKCLNGGSLLKKPKSVRALWTPVKLNNGKTEGFGGTFTGYAVGWSVMARKDHAAVAGVGGGRAAILLYPEEDVAVILLTNLSGCAPDELADTVAGFYFDQ